MAELETERLEASLLADSPEPQRPIFDIAKFKTGGGTDFREANGYSWDFVMVMPCSKPQDAERSAKFINKIRQAGLDVYAYKSVQEDEYICKIRCSVQRLAFQAASMGFKLPLDEQHVQRVCAQGLPEFNISPINIAQKKSVTSYMPYAHHYARFVTDPKTAALFQCAPGLDHPFDSVTRIKLIMDIIQKPQNRNGVGFVLKRKLIHKRILAYYPLHDDETREHLAKKWINIWQWPWQSPIDDIRNYFGEKIAMFFLFCSHYTSWLLPLSVISVAAGIDILVENNVDATLSPFYSIAVVFWAIFMLEYWKRNQATKAMLWGTMSFEEDESSRPEFKGKNIRSFIDGSQMQYYPPTSRNKMIAESQVAIFSLMLVVVGAIIAVVWVKIFMVKMEDDDVVNESGLYVPALLNAVQIQVMNAIYSFVAVRLNNRENHRTDTEYENSLIAKLFVFQFVNSFAALYYTAFIKENVEGECTNGGCMDELAVSVGTIFITRVISDNVGKYALPRLSGWWKLRQETKGVATDRELSRPEKEYVMETYDEMMGSLQDFANLSIQFGYVVLFATAFPLAPILAFFSNCINMVTDGHKLLFLHRRPIPRSAANIGTWYYIFLVITILAVITNAGLIAFTAGDFDMLSGGDVVWVFFGCQHLAFVFMAFFSVLVPDIPYSVTIQKKRTEFIVSKLIEHREDEFIDEDLLENGQDVEAAQIFDYDKED